MIAETKNEKIKVGDFIYHTYFDMSSNELVVYKERKYEVVKIEKNVETFYGTTTKYTTKEGYTYSDMCCVKA